MTSPITKQPTYEQTPSQSECDGTEWMIKPSASGGTPPGLEYLGLIDTLIIKQKKEWLEIFSGFETQNRYVIRNKVGQQVYYAFEESDAFERQCCKGNRGFTIHIVDNFNKEVMLIDRPPAWCSGCCCCADPGSFCSQTLTVEAPPGNLIGSIEQRRTWCAPGFYLKDMNGEAQLMIGTDDCCLPACFDSYFNVQTLEGEVVGDITRQCPGLIHSAFSDADTFELCVPMDLDINIKATLIGATFLIDFMCFER